MRELKFRAWNYTEKKMSEPFTISDLLRCEVMSGWSICDSVFYLQYTGLKDSNGKEIYESDILEYYSMMVPKGDTPIKRMIVNWNKREARFENCFNGKVIGNIMENPELLGDSIGGRND